jgi:GNAT superfamily N-acetyltransferase
LVFFGNFFPLEGTKHNQEYAEVFNQNTLEFSTRPARSGEEEILYNLIRELAQYEGKDVNSLPLTKEKISSFGFGKEAYFQVEFAESDQQIVGYALYYYGFSAYLGHPILYLEDLYVKPEYRGFGIGTQLLKQMAQYALEKDCCRLEWHVFSWNDKAIKFYQKIGSILRKDLIQVRLEGEGLKNLIESD